MGQVVAAEPRLGPETVDACPAALRRGRAGTPARSPAARAGAGHERRCGATAGSAAGGDRAPRATRRAAGLRAEGLDGPRRRATGTADGRAFLERLRLPADARERIEVALRMIDAIEAQIAPLERELRQLARRQTGYRALMGLYGMGELTSLVTLCELRDVGRPSASLKAFSTTLTTKRLRATPLDARRRPTPCPASGRGRRVHRRARRRRRGARPGPPLPAAR